MATIVGNRTLRSVLEYRARTAPERTFLIYDDLDGEVTRLSYGAFDAQVNRAAHLLLGLSVRSGDKINLHLPNCPAFLYLWFGAAKIGAVIMPTNVAATADELAFMVEHSESALAFTYAAHAQLLGEVKGRCHGLREVLYCDPAEVFEARLAEHPRTPPPGDCASRDEVAILYTSGTTARPKGVLVTNANYLYAGETVAKAIRLAPEDRHFVTMPLFHGNAQYYSTMSALVSGASMALMARFSASAYFERCIHHRCTVTSLFAAPIRMLLAQPPDPGAASNRLRAAVFAQNVTATQLDEWHARFGAPLLQLWGMTETMGTPLMNPIDGERRNMTMGLPTLGYEVQVVDEQGKPVTDGEVGQIVVRGEPGESLMKGYFKNPEATAETLRDGWLWSGDNARRDADGYFVFVDRAKDMIKRSGENVAASEVEAVILTHPKVFDCAVIGVPDPIRDEAIKAFVVIEAGEQLTAEEVIEWCGERLARFRVPEQVAFRDALPRTSVGKIQKHLLRRER